MGHRSKIKTQVKKVKISWNLEGKAKYKRPKLSICLDPKNMNIQACVKYNKYVTDIRYLKL